MVALRGEIEALRMETRLVETVLLFAKDTLTKIFEKVKDYMSHEKQTKKGEWIRTANAYRMELGITWENLIDIDRKQLKTKIREWDTQQWMEEVLHKPTL